jgi:hypothetical protein
MKSNNEKFVEDLVETKAKDMRVHNRLIDSGMNKMDTLLKRFDFIKPVLSKAQERAFENNLMESIIEQANIKVSYIMQEQGLSEEEAWSQLSLELGLGNAED